MKKRVAILLGGFSAERHVSLESGRNVYEKLSSSTLYEPVPVFLTGSDELMRFFILPINYLLKDNVEDINKALLAKKSQNSEINLKFIRESCRPITELYGQNIYDANEIDIIHLKLICDFVFIALHGHPGEDGVIQKKLQSIGLPYNGSDDQASYLMMNKFLTSSLLRDHDFSVAKQLCVEKKFFLDDQNLLCQKVSETIKYPCIVKPINDGCSAGVKKIDNQVHLIDYLQHIFFADNIKRDEIVIEEFINKGDAEKFMEITCGLITHYNDVGEVVYEVFIPSESVAEDEILSLEEKFLAGEGKNITPARFCAKERRFQEILEIVQKEIKRAAQVLEISGYARIDAFLKILKDGTVQVWIIEANSLPALTPATCIFHQCILNGYSPLEFLSKIIDFGFKRKAYEKK